ncbi:MAG: UDP-N-acetylglucosamine 1-carboxyvinyltransferase [bacterium]|nr:UDP-N-acetylglucosamine 1-carboxyvinyltransferase [bacterium]
MEKFIINGGKRISGRVCVSGSKNVALKALVAACLTDEEMVIENIPLISDFFVMADIIKELGGKVQIRGHTAKIRLSKFKKIKISLDKAAEIRTSVMFLAPLLARTGRASIPNPGGCRIGARPIDRTIEGLKKMGVDVVYHSHDGYFYLKTSKDGFLKGTNYTFSKNTHTGTETLLMAAVLAKGKTALGNTALEPEVDELINLLNQMGANIKKDKRKIIIEGVDKLHGTVFKISPDRNEAVTLAIGAIITGGDVFIENVREKGLVEFLQELSKANGGFEIKDTGIRFYSNGRLKSTDVTTLPYPGFMTDWQGPWCVLMTKAQGSSVIHETVYENRFGYVSELKKMGADIKLFNPKVENPNEFYNFNLSDDKKDYFHAAKISGPKNLHNGIVTMSDLRAGATLVLAALAAKGQSVVFGVEHLDRGYEHFEDRLQKLGADIKRVKE